MKAYEEAWARQGTRPGAPFNSDELSAEVFEHLPLVELIAKAEGLHEPERLRAWNSIAGGSQAVQAAQELLGS